jgi:hypothetical protein
MSRFAILPNNSPTLWEGGEPLTSGYAEDAVFDGPSAPAVSFSVKNLGFFPSFARFSLFWCVPQPHGDVALCFQWVGARWGTYGKSHRWRILIHFPGSPPSCTLHVGQIVASTGYSRERESITFCTNMDPRPSAGSGQAMGGRDDAARDEFHLYGRSEGPCMGRTADMRIPRIRPTCAKRSLPRSLLFPKYFGARD